MPSLDYKASAPIKQMLALVNASTRPDAINIAISGLDAFDDAFRGLDVLENTIAGSGTYDVNSQLGLVDGTSVLVLVSTSRISRSYCLERHGERCLSSLRPFTYWSKH